jgi:hypothetical protein
MTAAHLILAAIALLGPTILQAQTSAAADLPQAPSATLPGSISGTVLDTDGHAMEGVHIAFVPDVPTPSAARETLSANGGAFTIAALPSGPWNLTFSASGFTSKVVRVFLHGGETYQAEDIVLAVAGNTSSVEVTETREEIADDQIKVQEQQRIAGFIANYYVSYVTDPQPLVTRQKYGLATRTVIDPSTLALVAVLAGIQQADLSFPGYGYGPAGYGKRYAAAYGNVLTGTYIGGALLPSLLRQDPRYFYKGTGSIQARTWYAVKRSVVCQGDNGHPQFDFSGIAGGIASGALSNLYYPAANRNGAGLTFESAGYGIGFTAVSNLFEEFLLRHISTGVKATSGSAGR